MKIACVLGSPRKNGNSATIADHFLQKLAAAGAETRAFPLNSLQFKGCQACYGCKQKSEICILRDDLSEVLDAVRAADVLVMATPTYYGEVSSQLKAFVDRTFSFLVPDFHTSPHPSRLQPGKTLVFIITQGHPDEAIFADIFPRYRQFFSWYGYAHFHLIRVCGANPDDRIMERQDVARRIEETVGAIIA